MNKSRLLTSVAALALVVSLGACSAAECEEEGSLTGDEETEVTLYGLTASFALNYEGEAETLPVYLSAYVIGSWDSWGEFIKLEENGGRYEHTFASLEVGSYTYKVVLGYNDEEVSWDNCYEVTTTDQTLAVGAKLGNLGTIKVELTLSEALSNVLVGFDNPIDALNDMDVNENFTMVLWDYEMYSDYEEHIYDVSVTPDLIFSFGWFYYCTFTKDACFIEAYSFEEDGEIVYDGKGLLVTNEETGYLDFYTADEPDEEFGEPAVKGKNDIITLVYTPAYFARMGFATDHYIMPNKGDNTGTQSYYLTQICTHYMFRYLSYIDLQGASSSLSEYFDLSYFTYTPSTQSMSIAYNCDEIDSDTYGSYYDICSIGCTITKVGRTSVDVDALLATSEAE